MKTKEKARLLVLVCSCLGYQDRNVRAANAAGCAMKREACRRTWLAQVPNGVDYAFFVGGTPPKGEADVWGLDAPDTYHSLPEKVRAAFARALAVPGWEWLFKCDDDTFCHLPRLLDMADAQKPAPVVISWPGNHADTAHGGAGYLLPRAMVQAVVDDARFNSKGLDHEDKQVTYSVRRAGGRRIGDRRFYASMRVLPTPGNQQITCHMAQPDDMHRIHAAFAASHGVQEDAATPARPVPSWMAPQSVRDLPHAIRRQPTTLTPPPQADAGDGLAIPRQARRIVIFSNVTRDFDPRALPLMPGDHCIHINYARQFLKVVDTPGVTHALVVRRGTERARRRVKWYDPPVHDGFIQVLHVADVRMRARRKWWRDYCQQFARKCPTTGFICWHLAREAAPGLPVVLCGFAPGEHFGTPQWHGHAWAHEADTYARAGACIVRPDAPGMNEGAHPCVATLVLVCSSMSHKVRRDEARATWCKEVPPGMAVRFWCGADDAPPADDAHADDVVRLPGVPHAAASLPAATMAALRWAVANWNFSRVFLCHDDTFTALDRLARFTMPQGAAAVGNPDAHRRVIALHGGAGIMLTRDMAELIAYQKDGKTPPGADVYMSQMAQRCGGILAPDRRFSHNMERVPAPGNALITAHGCREGDMVRIMESLEQ